MARHVGEGVEHVGYSWIDHILLHGNGKHKLVSGGVEDHNDWLTVSDHRPLWIEIHLSLSETYATPSTSLNYYLFSP